MEAILKGSGGPELLAAYDADRGAEWRQLQGLTPGVRPDPEAFIEALDPLQPRLYSISSSPKVHKGRVSLTVDAVRYDIGKRTRLGVASTFLAGRINPGEKLRVYVQKAHAFGLPADPSVPVIMIGPGTGVAPFRAFLHERMATTAPGRNWLFFGHQKRDFDFFYEDEFNTATRLSLILSPTVFGRVWSSRAGSPSPRPARSGRRRLRFGSILRRLPSAPLTCSCRRRSGARPGDPRGAGSPRSSRRS